MSSAPEVRYFDRTTPPHITTLVLLAGIGAMNMSVFLPSLPSMAEHFETDYSIMQLAVSGYLAGTALLQVFIGPISDRFGRRPVMLTCLGIFLVATVGCLFAPTIEVFLAFRLTQGVVAGGMVLGRAIVRDIVETDQAASMIGYVTMGMALVPMVAPMIGGTLEQLYGWQATFVFMIGFGLVVATIAFSDQGETVKGPAVSFREQVRQYPELFMSPRFWGYVFAAAFSSGAFFAFLGGAPIVATKVFGLDPFYAGMGFGAPPVGYALGNYLSGRFATKTGINRMMIIGAALLTFGMTMSTLVTLTGIGTAFLFFGFCVFVGLGNGLVLPSATAGMLSVRPHLAGTASGLGTAFMIGGGAFMAGLTGSTLDLTQSALPLNVAMVISSALSLGCVVFVILRERQLARS